VNSNAVRPVRRQDDTHRDRGLWNDNWTARLGPARLLLQPLCGCADRSWRGEDRWRRNSPEDVVAPSERWGSTGPAAASEHAFVPRTGSSRTFSAGPGRRPRPMHYAKAPIVDGLTGRFRVSRIVEVAKIRGRTRGRRRIVFLALRRLEFRQLVLSAPELPGNDVRGL